MKSPEHFTAQPDETRITYLHRVLPDIRLIEGDVIDAAHSDFALKSAISRVQKLLEDLERAYAAE